MGFNFYLVFLAFARPPGLKRRKIIKIKFAIANIGKKTNTPFPELDTE